MQRFIDPDEPEGFDTAQICRNGHVVNSSYHDFPEFSKKHCIKCGAATITACHSCDSEIQGHSRGSMSLSEIEAPAFCHECGKPYPWTEEKQKAAVQLIEEIEGLSASEREMLKGTLPDLFRETPRSKVAVFQFNKLVAKVAKAGGDILRKLVIDIASEAIKKSLGPP